MMIFVVGHMLRCILVLCLSIMSFLEPLNSCHILLLSSPPSLSPTYYLDMPIDYPMICCANIDLGYIDNAFALLGGPISNVVS